MHRTATAHQVVAMAACLLSAGPGHASWVESADLIYNTAHVLDEGEVEVGILSPLQYGVSDEVQVSIHPVLLLLLVPHVGLRWRVSPEAPVTVAVSFEVAVSAIDRVNGDSLWVRTGRGFPEAALPLEPDADAGGRECSRCGVPWTVQSGGTITWELAEGWLLSGGGGPALDVVGNSAARAMVEIHGSLVWLFSPDDMLSLHASISLHPWYDGPTSHESLQLMWAHAFGVVHVALGVAVGEFDVIAETGRLFDEVYTTPVWPVVDVWWRF